MNLKTQHVRFLSTFWMTVLLTLACTLVAMPAMAAQLQVKHGSTVINENQTFDFGSTLEGNNLSIVLTIKNVGSSAVTLGPYSIGSNANDPGRFSVGTTNMPVPLAPQASGTVELIFHADDPGTVTNSFRIFEGGSSTWEFFPRATTTAPLGPIPRVEHSGSAVPHNSTFNFGTTQLGGDIVRTFRVFNDGDENLTIGTYGFAYSGNPQNSYTVENASVTNVPPGGSGTFDVRFHADGVETTTWKIRLFIGGVSRYEFWMTAEVEPPPMPDIRLKKGSTNISNGGSYSAGTIGYNDPLTVTFTAVNDGDAPLNISNISWTGDRLTLVQNAPSSINPNGGTGTFKLRLKADEDGPHSPVVSVWSNDPDENPYTFTLSWTVEDAIGPILRVKLGNNTITQGELVDFGNTGVGMQLTRTFTAFNDGDQPLSIAPIGISSHVNDPAGFSVGFNNAVNIPPGGNNTFRLDFDAAGLGSVTSEIDLWVAGTVRRTFNVKGTVLPPDFEISVSPASRTVEPGQNAFYTVSVISRFGYTGTVPLSISNLPPGTNHQFTPVNVAAGSSSQLKVRTFASTPPVSGATFTVSGNDGSATRSDTAQITVAESGDFTLNVTPSLRTVTQGATTTYTVELNAIDGFDQAVNLSRSGLPAGATASFNPSSLVPPGTSTLTVNTAATTPLGDATLAITGTGGGKTHSDTATLRVVDTPAGEPDVNEITPDRFDGGQIQNLTLTGQNLQNATVTIATTPAEPGDPTPPVYPDVSLVSINPAGTQMVVAVDARNPSVSGFYNLVIETSGGETGAPFRVLGNGPEVDIWSPKEPARGHLYSLSMLGVNLQGATVSVSGGGGVDVYLVSTAPGEVVGFLDIAPNAATGPRTLVVRKNGLQTQIPITVVANQGSSTLATINVTEEAQRRAALVGERVPEVLFQEFSARDDLAWAGQNGRSKAGICSITLGWQIYAYRYTLALPFDPTTGRVLFEILRNMNLGIPIPTGVRIFSAFADLVLQIKFNCFPVSHIQICLIGNIGYEIPGVFGQIFSAGGCFFGGVFIPVLQTTGSVSNFTFSNNGQCTDVVQTTPPTIGEQQALVTMNGCCSEPLRITTHGSSFGGTIYGFNWSSGNDYPVTEMTPDPVECNCACLAGVSPVAVKIGETEDIPTFIENTSDNTCTYQWHLAKVAGQGDIPLFTPSSGTVTLAPGARRNLNTEISMATNTMFGQPPTVRLDVEHEGHMACQAQTQTCTLPTGEFSTHIGWEAPDVDIAIFKGTLTPSADWSNTIVDEGTTGSNTTDSCLLDGMPFLNYNDHSAISGSHWNVNADGTYMPDKIGVGFNNMDEFLIQLGVPLPCELGTTQHMHMTCPAGLGIVEYDTNRFRIHVNENGVQTCRDGVCSPGRH